MKLSNFCFVAFVLFISLCSLPLALGFELYDPDDTGLEEKFVVTGDNCVLYPELGSLPVDVPPLTLLWRLEVPGTDDGLKVGKDGKTYCHVGNAFGEEWGWIEWKKSWDNKPNPDECHVTKWNTRFLHQPLPARPDCLYEIFTDSTASQLLTSYKRKMSGQNIYAFITQNPDTKSIDTNTDVYSLKPVFIYCESPNTSGRNTSRRNKPVQRANATNDRVDVSQMKLEVVFVIDTTLGTEPLIALAQQTCQKLVNEITKVHPEYKDLIRFGLVEFRDDTIVKGDGGDEHIEKIKIGGDYFISRVVQPLSDNHQEFLAKLNQLKTYTYSTGDEPEQVACGLMTALTEIKWSNNSTKHIILLGDAPNKQKALNPDFNGLIAGEDFSIRNACKVPGISDLSKVSLDDIVAYARNTKNNETNNIVNFHAVMYDKSASILKELPQYFSKLGVRDFDELFDKIDKDNRLDKEQKEEVKLKITIEMIIPVIYMDETERQFNRLAQNGGQFQGMFERIEKDSDIPLVADKLFQRIIGGVEMLQKARGSAETGESMVKVTREDGELAIATWEFAIANQKPRSTNNKVLYGYARAKDSKGNLVAEPTVLILYEDMENLHDNLVCFKKRLDKFRRGKGNLKMIFEDFRDGFGETAAGNPINDNTSIEDIIATQFPVKNGVLNTTLKQLRGMSKKELGDWMDKLDITINAAEFYLSRENAWNQSDWIPPKGSPQKYQYMKVSNLP